MFNNDTVLVFGKKVTTKSEFIKTYATDQAEGEELVNVLFKAGSLRQATTDEVSGAKTDGTAQSVHPYAEIDIFSKSLANDVAKMVKNMGIDATLMDTAVEGKFTLVCANISDDQLAKIKRRLAIAKASNAVAATTDTAAKTTLSTLDFASQHVAVPLTKAAINVGIGIFKIAGKFAVSAGSALINNVPKAYNDSKAELADDPDVVQAGKNISKVTDYIDRKINKSSIDNDVRVG